MLNAVRSLSHRRRCCAGGDECAYLLRATFDAANQNFADAQVLDTEAEGVQAGDLTVKETSGVIEILGNELKLTGAAANGWGDLGLYDTDVIVKAIGVTLLCEVQHPNADAGISLTGWHDANTLATDANQLEYAVQMGAGGTMRTWTDSGWGNYVIVGANVVGTTYELALVLGGYDINELAYYSGGGGTYTYGCAMYIKGGVFTTWTLLWRFLRGVDNVYPQIQQWENPADVTIFDNLRVPNRDYSAVLQPTCLSTFTAGNGTSLDTVGLPEVGGDWTERLDNWDIQGNRASVSSAAGAAPGPIATVDAGVADVMVDTVGQGVASNGEVGLALRYSDNDNFWIVRAVVGFNSLEIVERNAGGETQRASAFVVVNQSTDYDVRAIAYGQTIDGFMDGGNKISYASAALNENATIHGLHGRDNVGVTQNFDNFAIYSRESAIYDSELDSC